MTTTNRMCVRGWRIEGMDDDGNPESLIILLERDPGWTADQANENWRYWITTYYEDADDWEGFNDLNAAKAYATALVKSQAALYRARAAQIRESFSGRDHA